METLFELVLQFLFEVLLQGVFELLAEAGFHAVSAPLSKQRPAWVKAIGQSILGLIAGGISLYFFPEAFLRAPGLRLANLVVTPLIAGLAMAQIGRWRDRRGDDVLPLDRFGYAFLFALAMALTRYIWAK